MKELPIILDTLTEAYCCLQLDDPAPIEAPGSSKHLHVYREARIAACNDAMARLLGLSDASQLKGENLSSHLQARYDAMIDAFVDNGYRLKNYPVCIGESSHHILNAHGVTENGKVVRIWLSCTSITEILDQAEIVVNALEAQKYAMGRELHDNVGQILTALRIISQNLSHQLNTDNYAGKEEADKIHSLAIEASRSLSYLYNGLIGEQTGEMSLVESLEGLAEGVDQLGKTHCRFTLSGNVNIESSKLKHHLFRIAQEATNNAIKHAKAQTIEIFLMDLGSLIRLSIQDDGIGFFRAEHQRKTLGLTGMMYRARLINADLEITSSPGSGTVISCTVRK